MPLSDASHLNRDRAESFGSVAEAYDRYRPGYPAELIEQLARAAGDAPLLDIGTGTGKAATLLAARGVDVLGVEVDAEMARIARGHGLTVEIGSFESWDDAGRTFGVITAAQAWHWVDPRAGGAKVCRLLRPGGLFAPFWNFEELDDRAREAATGVYTQFAPALLPGEVTSRNRPEDRPYVDDLVALGTFTDVGTHVYRWERSVPVADWVGRVGTHSDHIALGAPAVAALQSALSTALLALGPEVRTTGGTYQVRARMAG